MKAYYCAGTHWDREWYEPFQTYRMWLVDLIEESMDIMEKNPDYKCFHLDGQAIVIDDYLEIRPENRDRLIQFLKDGRLQAGPWYNLPDEWLISGESYVRNLMAGMRICRSYGFEPMQFAYTPDQFGHIAALPMIMTGFGLRAGICWRGTADETHPAIFNWQGPDGSTMATFKLRDAGSYAPFRMFVRDRVKQEGFTDEAYEKTFEPYIEVEKSRTEFPLALLLDAVDHDRPDPAMPRIFKDLCEKYTDIEFIWGSLAEFGEAMAEYADQAPIIQGELREPARDIDRGAQYLIPHTVSSRYPIKQRNDQCQALMEKWAEPSALFEKMAGGAAITAYLDKGWEYLLKNHPHDSICGCSIDQVHRDMMYRFEQCSLIAENMVRRAHVHIAKASTAEEARSQITVHNPLPRARKAVVEIPIHFRPGWPMHYRDVHSSAEMINRFKLLTKDGTEVPYQLSRIERGAVEKWIGEDKRNTTIGGDCYYVTTELDLPAAGFTGLKVEPTGKANRHAQTLLVDDMTADSGPMRVKIHAEGTASVTLHSAEKTFHGLLAYEDTGDSGDGWSYGKLVKDIVYRSPGTRCTTAVDEDGPFRTVFRIERVLELPTQLDSAACWRSEDRTALRIVDRVYVEKDASYIRIRTTVHNTVKDHRLRVLFPSHVNAEMSFAETPYALVERPIAIPEESLEWHERVVPEKPFTTFCGLQDGHGGLAIIAPFGLHEYEVLDTESRTLAVTLLRSFYKTVQTAGEPEAELQQDLDFEYLIYPFNGPFDPVHAAWLAAEAQTGVQTHFTVELPDDTSYVSMEKGDAVVTAMKPADDGDGGIIRLWNPTNDDVQDLFRFVKPLKYLAVCNLNEEIIEEVKLADPHEMPVFVPAGGLTTMRFTW